MQARQVAVVDYTLLDYVTTVHVTMTTSINAEFYDAVDNLAISGGSKENTFAGLITALKMSNCHNFICVFPDEIGDDTNSPVPKPLQGIFADIGHVIYITHNIDADVLCVLFGQKAS